MTFFKPFFVYVFCMRLLKSVCKFFSVEKIQMLTNDVKEVQC